tara:strand:+ start:13009 stop:13809 length:801 start_codon:yes stop_codon:yes gene_type:complete
MTLAFISIGDLTHHYSITGPEDGPALVFANSLGTDFRTWDKVIEALPDGFRILTYDKRGHGLSGMPPGPYSMDQLVSDIESLMDHHGMNDAIFVGLSVGGIIAQGLWSKRPDLIRALVLSDTANVIGPKEMWDQRIDAITKGGIEPMGDAVMERWFSPGFRASRTAELAGYRNMLVRTPAEGYVGVSTAIRDADMTDSTRNINIPTMCIVGSDDGATTPAMVRALADLIDGARFEVIDGVGHLPCVEQPEIMAGLIESFLKENNLV